MQSLISAIGKTPLIQLQRIVDPDHAEVWLKLESTNPTGSYKDRMVLGQVCDALDSGCLENAIPLECTGGSTGTSLAFVCAAMGLPCTIITSDAFSKDKTDSMRAFGADVIIEPCENGKITPSLWQRMRDRATQMHEQGTHHWLDQFNNASTTAAFEIFVDEILEVSPRVSAFCAAVGTAGMLVGSGRKFRKTLPDIQVVAVEPMSSSVLSGNSPGPHSVDGTAAGFVPPLYDQELVDAVIAIDEIDARKMCNRLAREEGVFAGTSTGLNVCAALQLAQSLGMVNNNSNNTSSTVATNNFAANRAVPTQASVSCLRRLHRAVRTRRSVRMSVVGVLMSQRRRRKPENSTECTVLPAGSLASSTRPRKYRTSVSVPR